MPNPPSVLFDGYEWEQEHGCWKCNIQNFIVCVFTSSPFAVVQVESDVLNWARKMVMYGLVPKNRLPDASLGN